MTVSIQRPSLGELIREVCVVMPSSATPSEIAQAVIDKAGEELSRQYLLELMTATVYTRLAQFRNAALSGGWTATGNTASPAKPSAKQARVRDWWSTVLDERVPVGNREWKKLRDCTVNDIELLIADRMALIANIESRVSGFQKIIDAMKRNRVTTVGQLTADQVAL